MSAESDFAAALAEALGPLYRVSVVTADGGVEATYGEISSAAGRASQADLPLPKTSKSLRIEVDLDAVDAARRVVGAIVPATASDSAPSGAFTRVDRALDELISIAEAQMGTAISDMSRRQKQHVVRFLDERGAFNLRKSVETVADMLGVSRFTVYNYLDSSRGS